nr:hypothetical protein [Mycobacterium sp. IS-1496]
MAREVGVSRSSGTRWASGHKTYRIGVVVGFRLWIHLQCVRSARATCFRTIASGSPICAALG